MSLLQPGTKYTAPPEGRHTLFHSFQTTANLQPDESCLGTRRMKKTDANYKYGAYEWLTYGEALSRVETIATALHDLGIQKGDRVGIMSKTRREWELASLACLRQGYVLTPLYDNVGINETEHVINDAEISVLFIEPSRIDLLNSLDLSHLTRIILFNSNVRDIDSIRSTSLPANCCTLSDIMASQSDPPPIKCNGDDLASIVYTSGTTGRAKGTMLTNNNIMYSIIGLNERMPDRIDQQDVLISFLPLAHIFAFVVDHLFFAHGHAIGYYMGDMKGILEDVQALKPTLFVGVPRVFSKLTERVLAKGRQSHLKSLMFTHALSVRKRYLSGEGGAVLNKLYDRLVFSKIRRMFGNRIRTFYSGSAKLDPKVASLICCFFSAPIAEGYGTTETSAGGFIDHLPRFGHDNLDTYFGTVGQSVDGIEYRLLEAPEYGYSYPQGELCIKGPSVFQGYWKMDDKTRESFTEDGFYKTGDIAEVNEQGKLVIIDRVGAVVKSDRGEFINLGVLEEHFESCSKVDHVLVVGGKTPKLLAVVTPSAEKIEELQQYQQQGEEAKVEEFAREILEEFRVIAERKRHRSFEYVCDLELSLEQWTPDNGMLSSTFKKKRNVIVGRYKDDIDAMISKVNSKEYGTDCLTHLSCFQVAM
ncbi:hypothetical protein P9112_004934 [Eukaryota sp. TZLM1-RC]